MSGADLEGGGVGGFNIEISENDFQDFWHYQGGGGFVCAFQIFQPASLVRNYN